MKLIKPSVCIKEQDKGLEGVLKQIEWVGRHCYMSMDKITEDSAKEFVDRLIKNKHLAMLEHGTVYLDFGWIPWDATQDSRVEKYTQNKYSRVVGPDYGGVKYKDGERQYSKCYITTNYRVLVENGWLDDLQYLCEPTEYHEKRHTLKFTTSIGITRELIRHRHFSFANESTRYCNYSKDKFNNNITFVIPSWVDRNREPNDFGDLAFLDVCHKAEKYYLDLINNGYTPQQAREVLPLCTKSELVMTGFESDWEDFFDKRLKGTTGKPHPDMIRLCELAQEELTKNNIIL